MGGASGIYCRNMIETLGIAGAINAKATTIPAGFTAEQLLTGEAGMAVQQVSELMVVPGIEVVGPLPADIQTIATFSGGVLSNSRQSEQAAGFLRFLASPGIAPILRRTGLEPA